MNGLRVDCWLFFGVREAKNEIMEKKIQALKDENRELKIRIAKGDLTQTGITFPLATVIFFLFNSYCIYSN
jgi:hypothetical protein